MQEKRCYCCYRRRRRHRHHAPRKAIPMPHRTESKVALVPVASHMGGAGSDGAALLREPALVGRAPPECVAESSPCCDENEKGMAGTQGSQRKCVQQTEEWLLQGMKGQLSAIAYRRRLAIMASSSPYARTRAAAHNKQMANGLAMLSLTRRSRRQGTRLPGRAARHSWGACSASHRGSTYPYPYPG